jgi:hypothetical protein
MGFRFQKRIKILPGLRLNVSKTGVSWTVGSRGVSVTSRDGKLTGNVGIPGAGLSYRSPLSQIETEENYQPTQQMQTRTGTPTWLILLIVLVAGIFIGLSIR